MEARFEYRFVEINARGRDRIAVRDAVSATLRSDGASSRSWT